MPISPSSILYRYSTKLGTAGNQNSGLPTASLGKFATNNTIPNSMFNLFPVLTGDQNLNLNVDYLCFFVHNGNTSLTLIAPKIWISFKTTPGVAIALGVDPIVSSTLASGSVQALSIPTTQVSPSGVGFSTPTDKLSGLSLGDIGPNSVKAVWARRTAINSGALNADNWTVVVSGDTQESA